MQTAWLIALLIIGLISLLAVLGAKTTEFESNEAVLVTVAQTLACAVIAICAFAAAMHVTGVL